MNYQAFFPASLNLELNPSLGLRNQIGYNTQLTPAEEQKYQQWVTNTIAPLSLYMGQDAHSASPYDYDYRGFFLDPNATTGINPIDHHLHFTDQYKKPVHDTFSNYSQYAASNPGMAGSWIGMNDENMHYLPPVNTLQQLSQFISRLRDH